MIRLHANPFSGNSYKVRLLLGLLGVPYEMVEHDTLEGQTRTPEYLENVNPNGKIPVLELEDGTLLPESGAILFYLAEDLPSFPGSTWSGRGCCSGCSSSSTATGPTYRDPGSGS